MDFVTSTTSRWICAVLTAVIALVASFRFRSARTRQAILYLLIAAGLANVFLLIQKRIVHTNLAHYYLGAKYAIPYFDFYRATAAAQDKPQFGYRDLRNPDLVFRDDPRAQRLYYIHLLQQGGVEHPDRASLAELEDLCRTRGLLAQEAQAILESVLGPARVAPFRDDVGRMSMHTDDFGFNGSPFYVLVRQLDPAIHRPFGPAVCYVNLAWQILALFLMAFLAARALGWERGDALLVVALILASWDFTGWGLNGLVSAGWMLPAILAIWAFRRGRAWPAGIGVAWAGLVKLFPFVMALPLAVAVARRPFLRREEAGGRTGAVQAVRILLVCAASALVLAGASRITGLSWSEFLEKIRVQFQAAGYLNNSAGLSNVLLTLSIHKSFALLVPQLTVFLALVWILWMRREQDWWDRLPQTALVLLSCMAWLTQTWFNYYSVVALFLVPALLRRNRPMTVLLLAGFSLSFFLPDYGIVNRSSLRFLPIVKILPHLVLPLFALAFEIQDIKQRQVSAPEWDPVSRWLFRHDQIILLTGTALSVSLVCAELYRVHSALGYSDLGQTYQQHGQTDQAMACYRTVLKLVPRNAQAHFNLGSILEEEGDLDNAAASYRRTIELDPKNVAARNNLGILLMRRGEAGQAVSLFEEAAQVAPYDEDIQYNLGSALLALGRTNEAATCFSNALEIQPDLQAARERLKLITR